MVKDTLTNIYDKIPKSLITKYNNPNYKKTLMHLPFRCLVVGSSGSGKTTLVLELLSRMKATFEKIIICTKCIDEPLYKYLLSKMKKGQIEVYEGGEVPPVDNYAGSDMQILIVFDDLVNMKDQDQIVEYFLRSRKISGGISCMYLSQSYFRTPKTIRLNSNYMMLKKLGSTRDLIEILKDFSLGVDKKELLKIYKDATADKKNFLMVNLDAEPKHRFRENFLGVIKLTEFDEKPKQTEKVKQSKSKK